MMDTCLKILHFFCSVAMVTSIDYKDCIGDFINSTHIIQINNLEAPTHLNFPGLVHFNVNITYTKRLPSVFVDFHITRYIFGFPITLPCKLPTIVGTCENINICQVLNRTIGYMPNHPDAYGQKLQTIMNNTQGHYMKCPIEKETQVINDGVLELAEIDPTIHLLADGDYTIQVIAREKENGPVVGCIKVNATIGGQDDGAPPLVG